MEEQNQILMEQILRGMNKFRSLPQPRSSCNISHLETYTMMYIMKVRQTEQEHINVSQLAEKIGVSMQSLSRTLKNLERKGYIIREVDRSNRRNTLIELSEEGERVLTRDREKIGEYFQRVFSHFTNEELRNFMELQDKFYAAVLEETRKENCKNSGKEEQE